MDYSVNHKKSAIEKVYANMLATQHKIYNGIIVFICTDAWAPICIFLYVSGQNESVQLKAIGSLYMKAI